MSAPSPPAPTPPTPVSAPPKPTPAVPAPVVPAPPPPLEGSARDAGTSVRESLRVRDWTASGATKVLGNVEVDRAVLSGSASIGGTVVARDLRASGRLDVFQELRVVGRLELRGDARLRGAVEAGELDSAGAAQLGGALTAQGLVHFSGSLDVAGSLRAARVVGDGTLRVGGSVATTLLELGLRRESQVAEIRAERVLVRRGFVLPVPFPGFTVPRLTVARIDAKEVDLEGVECDYLKAGTIRLGAGCRIGQVDGNVVHRHPSAQVGPESRSAPPYGLTR